MPRVSRRRSGSRSPKRRKGSRAAHKSLRRRSRSQKRFRGVNEEPTYQGLFSKSERERKVDRFKTDFGKQVFTPGSMPFMKLFTFHACVNADELLKKDSEASERLLAVLESIGRDIGFTEATSTSTPKFSYAGHMKEINVRSNISGTRLSTHVARIMGEKLGQDEMVKVIKSLMANVQIVVKELEEVMGYTSFKEAKLISEYEKLDELTTMVMKELEKRLPDLELASKTLLGGMQRLKRFHKALFLKIFGPERLRMLQDQLAPDADVDRFVPKILARFADVPTLSKLPRPQRILPVAQPIAVASTTLDPAIPGSIVSSPSETAPLPNPNLPMNGVTEGLIERTR